jgi:hypothetical protein
VSATVPLKAADPVLLTAGDEAVSPSESASVPQGPETANGARCRVRTCRSDIEHQALTLPDSQIDSQKIRQSANLIEVIKGWGRLPEGLRSAVLAIVRAGGGNDAQ